MNKQDLFVKEYLKDLNATQAYIRAGYKFKSENVAAASAAKILRNPKIQEKYKQRWLKGRKERKLHKIEY